MHHRIFVNSREWPPIEAEAAVVVLEQVIPSPSNDQSMMFEKTRAPFAGDIFELIEWFLHPPDVKVG